MAHDLVIRGGFLVDGTGAPGRHGDLAVSGGRIAEVGTVSGRGAREVDAGGLVVAPGFIDPHTHYDAQLTWDPSASCTSWHGVTTIVTGNCGFTLAPCHPEDRLTLMKMLEYVEGMSLEAMQKGIQWEFETFREYLDALDRLPLWVNVAPLIGHSAVRQFVMRDAAWERPATADELERMGGEVHRAMADGAIGFSSTTNMNHVGDRGRPVPSRLGTDRELEYLAAAMGSTGRGIVELTIGGSRPDRVAEVDRYMELARASGRPVTMVSVRHNPVRPDEHRQILAKVEAAWREGLRLHPQGTCSPLTSTFAITNGFVFGRYKAWRRILEAKPSEWRGIMADPGFRADFRESVRHTALFNGNVVPLRVKRVANPALQHFAGKSVVEMARETGKDVIDAFFDLVLADDLRTEFMTATMNTDAGSVAEIFNHPSAVLGLSDAGAHITQFSEAGQTSQLLGHWVRERQALPIEAAVRLITSRPAEIFGIPDRGRLAPGLAADVTVFDPATIACHEEEIVHDMPDGGPRFIARSSGIQWSFVGGQPVIRDGRIPEPQAVSGAGQVIRAGA
ncbi:MAG TPA: amidohydrolase family protein [Candidatus Limnocylindrales bacterium]|nr:amidohydrolase family protein [Candidatus Limnocylindrales bacterium]